MTQYYANVLRQPTSALDVPDLQAMAKDHDALASLAMCRLTIVIAVQSPRNKEIIDKIQELSQDNQQALMKAIEQVRTISVMLLGQWSRCLTDVCSLCLKSSRLRLRRS